MIARAAQIRNWVPATFLQRSGLLRKNPILHKGFKRRAHVLRLIFTSNTSRTQNGAQIVMSIFAHASREEKIVSSFQRLWARARVFHPFRMPCKLRTPFTLTFFVMFRHTCFINRSGTYFNSELVVPTLLYTSRSIGPDLPFARRRSCRTAARQTGLSLRAQNRKTVELTIRGRTGPPSQMNHQSWRNLCVRLNVKISPSKKPVAVTFIRPSGSATSPSSKTGTPGCFIANGRLGALSNSL